jgi:ribosomal protein S26
MGDRLGKTNAIKRVIKSMIEEDIIREVSKETMKNTYQTIQVCYVLQDLSIL